MLTNENVIGIFQDYLKQDCTAGAVRLALHGAFVLFVICVRYCRFCNRTVGIGSADYIFSDKWHYPVGNCLSGKPGGTSDGGGMGAWKSAGFTILDSGLDIWIKKMRNAFRWRSAFSYYLVPVAVICFWFWLLGSVYQCFLL